MFLEKDKETTPPEPSGGDYLINADDANVQALCNTPDEHLYENVRINGQRNLPWIAPLEAHDRVALICGGGPSLKDSIPEIAARASAGQHLFAINGAAQFLAERGVKPGWFITMDSRPENVRFVKSRPALRYILASQCAPELFDELQGEDIGVLHPAGLDRISDYLPKDRNSCYIGGGITTGLTALACLHTLGYREIHLFGYDSSDAPGGETHAYSQEQTDPEKKRLQVYVGGRQFSAQFAMYKQAHEFEKYALMLADEGMVIHVHGDGLLPAIAREMVQEIDYSRAVYDLARCPASYDFIVWLVIAEMARRRSNAPGPLRVAFAPGPNGGFRNDTLPVDTAGRQQFFDHVMRPALELIGAVEDKTILATGYRPIVYTVKPIVDAEQPPPRLSAPAGARAAAAAWLKKSTPVVIVLREASHWPERNSHLLNWMRFAGYLKSCGEDVVIVRDTEKADEPLSSLIVCKQASRDLHFRIALYERARCVIGMDGPSSMALFTGAPCLIFIPTDISGYRPSTDEWRRAHQGIGHGEQFPWSRPDQRLVWEGDNYPAMRKAWDEIEPLLKH